MNKLKIMLISSEFPPGPGGIGKHAFDIARSLVFKDNAVTVFTSQDFAGESEIDLFNEEIAGTFNIKRFKRTGITTYYNRWRTLQKWLSAEQPDLIIVTGRFSLWMGMLISKRFRKIKNIHAFIHGTELSKINVFYHFLTIQSIKSIPKIWAVSTFTRNLIQEHINIKDIKILPNGLWFEDWGKASNQSESIALQGNPSLLTVGQISPRKGQHRILAALPEIRNKFPNIHYHMIGIPTDKEKIMMMAKEKNIADLITIHGRILNAFHLQKYYNASKIFIMLSENQYDGDAEGFGIAILEANYFGKPAIGAKGCGIEDAISDGYNGILVDGNNANEITEAIAIITSNYESFSTNAKNWALKHDWKILITQFIKSEA